MDNQFKDLPENVSKILAEFVAVAKLTCGENLISIVLFGSAAEVRH